MPPPARRTADSDAAAGSRRLAGHDATDGRPIDWSQQPVDDPTLEILRHAARVRASRPDLKEARQLTVMVRDTEMVTRAGLTIRLVQRPERADCGQVRRQGQGANVFAVRTTNVAGLVSFQVPQARGGASPAGWGRDQWQTDDPGATLDGLSSTYCIEVGGIPGRHPKAYAVDKTDLDRGFQQIVIDEFEPSMVPDSTAWNEVQRIFSLDAGTEHGQPLTLVGAVLGSNGDPIEAVVSGPLRHADGRLVSDATLMVRAEDGALLRLPVARGRVEDANAQGPLKVASEVDSSG